MQSNGFQISWSLKILQMKFPSSQITSYLYAAYFCAKRTYFMEFIIRCYLQNEKKERSEIQYKILFGKYWCQRIVIAVMLIESILADDAISLIIRYLTIYSITRFTFHYLYNNRFRILIRVAYNINVYDTLY